LRGTGHHSRYDAMRTLFIISSLALSLLPLTAQDTLDTIRKEITVGDFKQREGARTKLKAFLKGKKITDKEVLAAATLSKKTRSPEVRASIVIVLKKQFFRAHGRGYLGVHHSSQILNLNGKEEATITVGQVSPNSPAQKSGFLAGDNILVIGGTKLALPPKQINAFQRDLSITNEFSKLIKSHSPGDKVEIQILRNGKAMTLTPTLARYPEINAEPTDADGFTEIERMAFTGWYRKVVQAVK